MASTSNRKGLNSLIIVGAWTLWRHHSDCVFNGSTPRTATTLVREGEQIIAWKMAGTKGLAMIPELEGELEDRSFPSVVGGSLFSIGDLVDI
jgi:hypothetical protein